MIDGDDLALLERSLRHATDSHTGPALDAALMELGWHDALVADPRAAVALLFSAQGSANAASSALDQVLAHALGLGNGVAVLLPAVGEWSAPGRLERAVLQIHGVGSATLAHRETVVVVAAADGGQSHLAFAVAPTTLQSRPVAGMDPSLGLADVGAELVDAREIGPVDWRTAVALGQLALGHELVGASRRMLELARQHALERVQFGRPIAKFQAIRHRLAETLVAIEGADAMLAGAWLDHAPATAAMGKAVAGRAARDAARHCQQVLAGIGFTTEHPLHRYVWRVLVLEQLLGSTHHLTRELGGDIIERRELPALLPL